jgi:hypothetical protein
MAREKEVNSPLLTQLHVQFAYRWGKLLPTILLELASKTPPINKTKSEMQTMEK